MTNVAKIDPDKDPDRRFSHLPSFPRVHVVRHGTINTALATALDVFPHAARRHGGIAQCVSRFPKGFGGRRICQTGHCRCQPLHGRSSADAAHTARAGYSWRRTMIYIYIALFPCSFMFFFFRYCFVVALCRRPHAVLTDHT